MSHHCNGQKLPGFSRWSVAWSNSSPNANFIVQEFTCSGDKWHKGRCPRALDSWGTPQRRRQRGGRRIGMGNWWFGNQLIISLMPHTPYISLQAGTHVTHPCTPATRTVPGTQWALSKLLWTSGYNPWTVSCIGHRNTEAWSYITHKGKKENPAGSMCWARCVWMQRHRCLVIAMIFIWCSENRFSWIAGKSSELGPKPPPHHGPKKSSTFSCFVYWVFTQNFLWKVWLFG